jgi:hypothetical protein
MNAIAGTRFVTVLASLAALSTLASTAQGAGPAAAPAPAPAPVNGTIVSLAPGSLSLKTTEMQQITVAMAPTTRVVDTINITLGDIRSGDFLGTTASPKDGKLVASEVHVFDEALRGTGEGHYPWTQPGSTMTNGAVATMTNGSVATQGTAQKSGDPLTMTVTYKGGQQVVTVPAGTPVTRVRVVDASQLKAGQRVTVFGAQRAPQTMDATLISVAPPAPEPAAPAAR